MVDNLPRMLKVLGLIPGEKGEKEQGRKKERRGGREEGKEAGSSWPEIARLDRNVDGPDHSLSDVLCACQGLNEWEKEKDPPKKISLALTPSTCSCILTWEMVLAAELNEESRDEVV